MLIEISGLEVDSLAENIQDILRQAYADRQRPKCLCVVGGVPLYIAKINNAYILKLAYLPVCGI